VRPRGYHSNGFKKYFERSDGQPSGSEARIFGGLGGTAKAVPYPRADPEKPFVHRDPRVASYRCSFFQGVDETNDYIEWT
jgi:hypothetical protein